MLLDSAPLDVAEMISLCLEQYAPLAEEAGIRLVDEASSVRVVADEGLLIQVLVNLLDNALAHTPAGGTIAVGCAQSDQWVEIWVSDTGKGIAPEHQARVFDRFYRVDAGRARANGGTGLGLALCKAIVEAHHGKISLTSEVGKGARVDILLPVGQPENSAQS